MGEGGFQTLLSLWQKSSVLCVLLCPNGPQTSFNLIRKSRQQVVRAYCPDICTVTRVDQRSKKKMYNRREMQKCRF